MLQHLDADVHAEIQDPCDCFQPADSAAVQTLLTVVGTAFIEQRLMESHPLLEHFSLIYGHLKYIYINPQNIGLDITKIRLAM
jgi:hypothetical protein